MEDEKSRKSKKITRRNLLKIAAGAGGAVIASSLLPEKWIKPLMKVGVVPLHAQNSVGLSIGNLQLQTYNSYLAEFNYSDPVGKVDSNSILYGETTTCGELLFSGSMIKDIQGAVVGSNPYCGLITFNFEVCNASENGTASDLFCVYLEAAGRKSNTLCDYLPKAEKP